jgi:tetratricopeptide (TPR) repeat protein
LRPLIPRNVRAAPVLFWVLALLLAAPPANAGAIWQDSPPLVDALKQATEKNTHIVIKMTSRWCAPCRRLELELNKPAMLPLLGNTHRLAYDGHSGEGLDIVRRFNVVSFPTLLLINARARELGRITGFREVSSLVSELQALVQGSFSLKGLEAALGKNPHDLALRMQLGKEWALRGERAKAEAHLNQILTLASGAKGVSPQRVAAARTLAPRALLVRGKVLELLSLKDPARAERTLRSLVKLYPRGAEAKKAGLYIAWAMLDQGKTRAGRRALSRWAKGDAGRELAAARLCLRDNRAPEAATRHARGAAALAPKNAAAWATLGRALFGMDRTRLAVKAMAKAVELAPNAGHTQRALHQYRKRLAHEAGTKKKR